VILAFDVSAAWRGRSQADAHGSRKAAAQNFVAQQPRTVQIGVVAFSDSGVSVQAPTNDRDVILAAIKRLTPERGTSLATGFCLLETIADLNGPVTHFYSTDPRLPLTDAHAQGLYTSAMMSC